jgi:hypothetical protein
MQREANEADGAGSGARRSITGPSGVNYVVVTGDVGGVGLLRYGRG